jgi:hypothetical protein
MKNIETRFLVLKEIIISHPPTWKDKELRELAEDITDITRIELSNDWDLHNVAYTKDSKHDYIIRMDK